MGTKTHILGIETSCDETAVAVVADGLEVLSNCISSQVPLHQIYGGVVPELASRKHVEAMDFMIQRALDEAQVQFQDLHGIAVTYGPGLVGSLLIGLVAAKTLAWSLDLPLIGVNHILGHVYANLLEHKTLHLPLLCLTVSGGHTDLLYMEDWSNYTILGRTRDDAAGEAFDKVARFLGLPYPGGPEIEKLAREGREDYYVLPRPGQDKEGYTMSFSGLKTAVINLMHTLQQRGDTVYRAHVAASFQKAVVDVLGQKVEKALVETGVKTVLLSGGVAANGRLRERMADIVTGQGARLYYPSLAYCTDNGAMIACAGYYLLKDGQESSLELDAQPRLTL